MKDKDYIVISRKLFIRILAPEIRLKLDGVHFKVYLQITPLTCDEDNLYFSHPIDCEGLNYFCYNSHNKITAWQTKKGPQPCNEAGKWKAEGRIEVNPGKFLKFFSQYMLITDEAENYSVGPDEELGVKIINRACEVVCNRIKGINSDLVYHVSSNVTSIYELTPHHNSGYVRNSCMRDDSGHNCSNYKDFYDYLPDLNIVYNKEDNYLLFRALLWKKIYSPDINDYINFLDRPYGSEVIQEKLIELAKSEGWAYRHYHSSLVYYNNNDGITLNKELPREAARYLQLNGSPFMDTLFLITKNNDKLILTNRNGSSAICLGSIQDSCGSKILIYKSCQNCGCILEGENIKYFHDKAINRWYCLNCMAKLYTTCCKCEKEANKKYSEFLNVNGCREYFCPDCSDKHLGRCCKCEDLSLLNNLTEVDGHYFCKRCYNNHIKNCDSCKRPAYSYRSYIYENCDPYIILCRKCREHLVFCTSCSTVLNNLPFPRMIQYCNRCTKARQSKLTKAAINLERPRNSKSLNPRVRQLKLRFSKKNTKLELYKKN